MMQFSAQAASFVQDLRQATAPQHSQLEANEVSKRLMNPNVTVAQYAHYLSCMYPVIAFCETYIFPVIEQIIPTDERRKLHLLDKDLAALHHAPATAAYQPLTLPVDIATAFGHMYVIEGSTLGGRVIVKHIHKHLGLDEHNGAAFFIGYGNATGPLWQSFMATFTEYIANTQSEAVVIAAAQDTFAAIDEYFKNA